MQRLMHALAARPQRTLCAAVVLWFGPALLGYFFDDDFGILTYYQSLTWGDMFALARTPAGWRFVNYFGSWLQFQLFGVCPVGYKLVSISAYAAVVVLIYQCIRRCGASQAAAWAAALVFALLPAHRYPAYYMTRPPDFLWAVLGVWCFTHPAYPRWVSLGVLGGVCLVAALFAYEANLSIGAAVVGVSILSTARDQPWLTRSFLARTAPIAILTLAYGIARFGVAKNLGFYYDVRGVPESALAQGPLGLFMRYATALSYIAASHTHLLRADKYPAAAGLTVLGPLAAVALCLWRGAPRPGRRAAVILLLWWAGAGVPFMDGFTRVDAERRYLFYVDWPLVTALALFAPPPDAARYSARLWGVVLGVVAAASAFNAHEWMVLHRFTRQVVLGFDALLPNPPAPRHYYIVDPPVGIAHRHPFSLLPVALLLPVPPEDRALYEVHEQLDFPHDPALEVPAAPPDHDTWPIEAVRWEQDHWAPVPLPAWARPAVPGAPDLAAWREPRSWEATGWRPNQQLVPVQRGAARRWYTTSGRFALLTGPPLPASSAPLAWAVVTMTVRAEREEPYADWLFVTASDGVWDERKVVRFRIRADGRLHTYAVPIVAHPRSLLAGPVTRVALRPVGEPDALVRIDRIRLVPLRASPPPD